METEQHIEPLTRGIVIFGATGDLCRKKLIPALYKLWYQDLIPRNFLITGASGEILELLLGKNLLENIQKDF